MTISEFKGSEELNMLLIALGKKDEELKNKPKTKFHPISPTKPTEFEIQRLISQVTIELARKKK